MNKNFVCVVIGVLVFWLGLVMGWQFAKPAGVQKTVTADVILTGLHDRGFLVTKTYIFNQPITIENSQGSFLKDLFFGQTIEAHGTVEVNLGVDLQKIGEDDVLLSQERVGISLPTTEIFNSRLVGPVDVENSQGVLKRLFDHDDGYNQAMAELIAQAEEAVRDERLLQEANRQAIEEVKRLVGLSAPDREVVVEIKAE